MRFMPRSLRALRAPVVALSALSLVLAAALPAQQPRRETAAQFLARAEAELLDLSIRASRAQWVSETYINQDTEQMTADATAAYGSAIQRLVGESRRFTRLRIAYPPEIARKFYLLKLLISAPPPADSARAAELAQLGAQLNGEYGRGSWCRPVAGKEECLQIGAISQIMATSRDPRALLDAWAGWHKVGAPMRERYLRFAELSNEGARGMGFKDAGAMWRSGYDMAPEAFEREMDRLWGQLRPLYLQLHAYTRARLVEKYGPQVVPPTGLIPAHLLGNLWAQEWGNIYDLVAPPGGGAGGVDVTALLAAKQVDPLAMVRFGEGFFTSLGFAPLPQTFWERSQFTKPRDREVVCHASAWDIDAQDDLRIKMCIEPTGEDFVTVHHELGHNFYQRAYKGQPFLFQNGANDGFHEAIGDAVALAITPEYLQQVGLLAGPVPGPEADIPILLRQAMDKVAFLPWGLLVDKWRWQVFDGRLNASNLNAGWWQLRRDYQGVSEPLPRTEADFDPGAKFHVPGNTPYARYFLARILQFQFYRGLCREAGYTGPLHRCTFFNNKAAGARLAAALEAGQGKPWQETLFALTGERQMDAGAMAEYFEPLRAWLERQNQGKPVGW